MKNVVTTLKLLALSSASFMLLNCSSVPSQYEQQAEHVSAEQAAVQDRVKRERAAQSLKKMQQSKLLNMSSGKAKIQQLIDTVEQNKQLSQAESISDEQTYINDQYRKGAQLSDAEKSEFYRIISRYPEAAGQLFKRYKVNPTIQTQVNPVSTFAMDVDNGSFKLAAAMLNRHKIPNPDGIRIEEFVNAMDYQYAQSSEIFSLSAEAMPSPFRQGYHVLHIGAQSQNLNNDQRNPSNLVLVVDVSGSMANDNKLPLLQNAMKTLVSQLNKNDQVAIVEYNNHARTILAPTAASKKRKIFSVIDKLKTGGGTNVETGLSTGYQLMEEMYQPGFNNRVILTSDGLSNSGRRSPEQILAQITNAKRNGVFLTTLGVGLEVYNDHLLEQLANQGNGTYLYVANQDDIQESFVDNLSAQLQTVAKDAKVQVKFNPELVSHYRLLGYENRHLEQQDFLDGSKDGAEVGAGQKVTAIYEIKLVNSDTTNTSDTLANVAVAYKKPSGKKVYHYNKDIPASLIRNTQKKASPDTLLSVAVAAFAEKLRASYWARFYDYKDINTLINDLPKAYRKHPQVEQLVTMIEQAESLDNNDDVYENRHPISQVSFERVPLLD